MSDLAATLAAFTQADRAIRIETPLGTDVLLPEHAALTEGVNDLFTFRIAVRSKRSDLKPAEIVGHLADVSLDLDGTGPRRSWNGLVTELHEAPNVLRGFRRYTLVLRPHLWLMSQRSDCRIWQDQSSLDVLRTLMAEHDLPAAQVAVLRPPAPQHYSVQWNETDLAYLRRRLEEDGLAFWHKHQAGQHTLVVTDGTLAYTDGPDPDVRFSLGSADKNILTEWSKCYRYTPGVRAGADWNFQTPGQVPGGRTKSLVQLPRNARYELYEYPSRISSSSEAEQATKLRMQATEVDHEEITGAATVRTLGPGLRFKPYDLAHPEAPYEPHVVLSITHQLVDRTYEAGGEAPDYAAGFTALPARLPATPHRDTHRPRLDGTQVALIAGPAGEEIHTDEFGRVKLWFPWDRRAAKDGSDTCWVRVVQSWGGGGWGAQVIPRVGMEAMVAYQDGDPDRPIVVGLVPNPEQHVPYGLPANKTKSVFRTNTYKGKGFNELTFEDATAREEVYLHAQRDHTIHVENNRAKRVDNNQSESVGHNKSIEVGNNHQEIIGGNMTLMVGPNMLQKFVTKGFTALTDRIGALASKLGIPSALNMGEGNLIIAVGKNKGETVMVSSTEVVGGAKATTVGGGYQIVVGGVMNRSVGIGSYEEVGSNKATVVGKMYEVRVGKSKLLMTEDGVINLSAVKIVLTAEQLVQVKAAEIELN